MDIDMRLPSFNVMRPTASTSKRPRSPTSPTSPHDRPHKRLTLSSMTATTTTTFPSGLPSPMPTPPPLTTRQLSEDWVSRTRGLRIDRDRVSPTIEEEPTTTAAAPVAQDGDDINMEDEPLPEFLPSSGCAPTLSQPSPIRLQLGSAIQDTNRRRPGHIEIPAFSEQSFFASRSSDHAPLTPTTPPRSAMDINPEDIALPLSPPRKPRFTMGPRSDCEKCRLRVPGHYSHFN